MRTTRRTRPLLLLPAVLASVSLVGACSGGGDGDGQASASSSTPAAETSTTTSAAGSPGSTAGEASDAVTLDCDAGQSSQGPPGGFADVLGAVALPTKGARPEPLAVDEVGSDGPDEADVFAEVELYVRNGTASELVIADDEPDGTYLGWGSPAAPTRSLSIPECPGNGWTTFSGGWWAPERSCVHAAVRTGSSSEPVEIQVGDACPQ